MKNKIFKWFPIAFAVLVCSCEDFLDTESKSTYTPDVVFSSTVYTSDAIVGIYSSFITTEVWNNFYYPFNTDIEIQEFSTSTYDDNERRSLGNYVADPGNIGLASSYTAYYKAVERANLCIEGIQESPLYTDTENENYELMAQYLGEALTLRAYLYMELIRNWGDVPFKNEATNPDGSNFYSGKTDRDEIYDNLIEDLQEAIELLPWYGENSNSARIERVTKGFAKGLLAQICLNRGGYSFRSSMQMERGSNWEKYYEIARTQCKEIIDNGTHRLTPSFVDIWKKLCGKTENEYNENLIEFGFEVGESGEQGYIAGWKFNTGDKYGYGNQAGIRTTPAFLYSFDPQDSRRLVSVAVAQYDTYGVQQIIRDAMALNIGKWNRKWMTNDYIGRMQSATTKLLTGINWVPLRMSNIYLMLAEVENALPDGDISVAREALRAVRSRAFNEADQATRVQLVDNYVNALSKGDDFQEAIMQERAWEFAGESIRKWDLIRWNKLTEKIQEARTLNAKLIQKQAPYHYIPDYLFVKWDTQDYEEIDYTELNLDEDMGSTDISGFTRISWYPVTYSDEEEANDYLQYLNAWACGLDGGNGFRATYVKDRHLLPLPQSAIDSSAVTLENEYGF